MNYRSYSSPLCHPRSPFHRRHPVDKAYSEEEAARSFSPDKHYYRSGREAEKSLQLCDANDPLDDTLGFEFVMSRVKSHEMPPLTPVAAWKPWLKDGYGDMDCYEDFKLPATSKRRTILFSVSTTKHERVEHNTTNIDETGSLPDTVGSDDEFMRSKYYPIGQWEETHSV